MMSVLPPLPDTNQGVSATPTLLSVSVHNQSRVHVNSFLDSVVCVKPHHCSLDQHHLFWWEQCRCFNDTQNTYSNKYKINLKDVFKIWNSKKVHEELNPDLVLDRGCSKSIMQTMHNENNEFQIHEKCRQTLDPSATDYFPWLKLPKAMKESLKAALDPRKHVRFRQIHHCWFS